MVDRNNFCKLFSDYETYMLHGMDKTLCTYTHKWNMIKYFQWFCLELCFEDEGRHSRRFPLLPFDWKLKLLSWHQLSTLSSLTVWLGERSSLKLFCVCQLPLSVANLIIFSEWLLLSIIFFPTSSSRLDNEKASKFISFLLTFLAF